MSEIGGRVGRRRFLTISAAAVCSLLSGGSLRANSVATWKGVAMGAGASLRLTGNDSERTVASCLAELSRLEDIFSLYRRDSALNRLNRHGRLSDPPPELIEVLAQCDWIHHETLGAFDPTVQPLWQYYAQEPNGRGRMPASVFQQIGWDHVSFDPGEVRFGRPGMAMTLNGIAQGFVSDRIAALLRAEGYRNAIVDMGEISAIGGHEDGRPWRVGIADPTTGAIEKHLDVTDRAVATSSPIGTRLRGAIGHIFDPRRAGTQSKWRRVTVTAPSATVADGFSTALCLMGEGEIGALLRRNPDLSIDLA